ncbi:MAG TPA: Ig-like domain-containing protein [Acidimicrobiia bacterium]|nr:Ig-like domain-containing protein [Acidimicrobiia bacterium]
MPLTPALADEDLCSGEYVASFGDHLTRGVGRTGDVVELAVAIPPGVYDVTLVSSDNNHPEADQPNESWGALLYADGELIAATGFSDDLDADDDIASFDLAEDVEVLSTVTAAQATLALGGYSITAECAVFEVITQYRPPITEPDEVTTNEDEPVAHDVLANDSDPDEELLTAQIVEQPANGTAWVDDGTGEVVYQPNDDFNGGDSLLYEACDPIPICTGPERLDITVLPVPDPPVAFDDDGVTAEDVAVTIDVAANDVDVDGDLDRTSVSPSDGVNGQTTVDGDGIVTYVPDPGFVGDDGFVYQICDLAGECDSADVAVTVISNAPPVAGDDSATVIEDGLVVIDVVANDADPDGNLDPSTVTLVAGPAAGTVSIDAVSGALTLEPESDSVETQTMQYSVCDTFGACSDPATVVVTVTPVNDAPSFVADAPPLVAINAGPVVVTDWATFDPGPMDEDWQRATYVVDVADPGLFAASPTVDANGTLRFTPGGVEGSTEMTVLVSDDGGTDDNGVDTSPPSTFTIFIGNGLPNAVNDAFVTDEDVPVTINVAANDGDPDGDVLQFSLVSAPSLAKAFDLAADGLLVYEPLDNEFGTDTLIYEACDPGGLCDEAEVTISIVEVNDRPVAQSDKRDDVLEDGAVEIAVLDNDSDVDGEELRAVLGLEMANLPQGEDHGFDPADLGSVRVTDAGTIAYVPPPDSYGTQTFTYHACDPRGLCDPATVTVDVAPVNDAPSFSASNPPAISPDAGRQTIAGWASFTRGPSNEQDQSVSFVVTNVSDPRLFDALPAVTAAGELSYTPSGVAGSSTFTVVARDDGGTANGGRDRSSPGTFEISVRERPDNSPPTVRSDVARTEIGGTVAVDVLQNDDDPDGDRIFVDAAFAAEHGSVEVLANGFVGYTPAAGYYGADSFSYRVCDDGNPVRCAVGIVRVTVEADPADLVDVALNLAGPDPQAIQVGHFARLVLVVSNEGPAIASGVVVEIGLPDGAAVLAGNAQWSVPALEPGDEATKVLLVRGEVPALVGVVAEVVESDLPDADSSPADGGGDDYATASILVNAVPLDAVGAVFVVDENRNSMPDAWEVPPADESGFVVTVTRDVPAESAEPFAVARGAGPGGGQPGLGLGPVLAPSLSLMFQDRDCAPGSDGAWVCRGGAFVLGAGAGWYTMTVSDPADLGYRLVSPAGPGQPYRVRAGGTVVFLLAPLSQDPGPLPQGIEGTVRQLTTNGESVAVEGRRVIAREQSTGRMGDDDVTDRQGTYRLDLPPGTWEVSIPGEDVVEPAAEAWVVELPPNETAKGIDFGLAVERATNPVPGSLTVIVWKRSADDSSASVSPECGGDFDVLEGVQVQVLAPDGTLLARRTDGTGCAIFSNLGPGTYTVALTDEGVGAALLPADREPEEVEILPDSNTKHDIPLQAGETGIFDPEPPIEENSPFPWWILLLIVAAVGLLWWWGSRSPPGAKPFPPPPVGHEKAPYPGPQSFTTADPRFFGRDNEVRRLVAMTYANRVTVLFGPSGAGKTSLLLAGYFPALDVDDFDVYDIVRFRADEPRRGGGAGNPFIRTALATWAGEEGVPDGMTFRDWFATRERRYDELGDPLARVLVFDQFEQMFTPYPERWEQRQEFFRELEAYLAQDDLDRIVISIQEAQLGELEPLLDLLDLHSRTQFRLNPLEADEAVAALVRPLANTGVRFAEGLPERIATDLRRVPVEDAGLGPQPLGQFVDPLRLQLVALAAWRRRGRARMIETQEVRTWTGTEQALTDFYDEAVLRAAGEGIDEGELRRWIEVHLITSVGARSRASSEDLAGLPEAAIRELEQSGLIVRAHGPGGESFLLAHDRFIAPILVGNEAHRDKRLVDLSTSLLTRAAATWVRSGRSHEFLLSGDELEDAKSLARDHPELIRGTQRAFLEESEAAAAAGSTAS